jgi:Na+/proline symporter
VLSNGRVRVKVDYGGTTHLLSLHTHKHTGYGIAVAFSIIISFLIGICTYLKIQGKAENFFVAGHSLPLWMVAVTLAAASVDSNSLLGNIDYAYKFSFYDGAVIPIGLGLSLIINGIFLATHINKEHVLTVPDVLARRYGKTVETLISLSTITSFLMLLAGNLVGIGVITAYSWGISESLSIWICAAVIWGYTVTGGLFSVAYTDVLQGAVGWSGCIVVRWGWVVLFWVHF